MRTRKSIRPSEENYLGVCQKGLALQTVTTLKAYSTCRFRIGLVLPIHLNSRNSVSWYQSGDRTSSAVLIYLALLDRSTVYNPATNADQLGGNTDAKSQTPRYACTLTPLLALLRSLIKVICQIDFQAMDQTLLH